MMKKMLMFSVAALLAFLATAPANAQVSPQANNQAKAQEGALKLPAYKKAKLKNGITLLLMEQHEVPIISLNFIMKAGSVADSCGKGRVGFADCGSAQERNEDAHCGSDLG